MLISVTLASSSSSSAGAAKLPSGLAKLSNDEIVLIELQGSLEVEATHPSERNGKFVGTLTMDEAGVCSSFSLSCSIVWLGCAPSFFLILSTSYCFLPSENGRSARSVLIRPPFMVIMTPHLFCCSLEFVGFPSLFANCSIF